MDNKDNCALERWKKGMTEEKRQTKKKFYVETTVVSDATALPTNDLSVVGRQITTRTWWARAMTMQQEDTFVERENGTSQ